MHLVKHVYIYLLGRNIFYYENSSLVEILAQVSSRENRGVDISIPGYRILKCRWYGEIPL